MTDSSFQPLQEVIFYVLNSSDPKSRDEFNAKLIQKIIAEKRQADVLFDSYEEAQRFDLTLWGIRPHSFIAHAINLEVKAPIQLFDKKITQGCQDILLNLHTDFQTPSSSYKRTIEVLDQTPLLIQKGRERFKQYRMLAIKPVVHKIGY